MTSISPITRTVDYLRISITDRCNERCLYCMPEGFSDWKQRDEILSYEEILAVVETAIGIGFRKFRVTGGEPLVRRGAEDFIKALLMMPGVGEVALSTNGTHLAPMAAELGKAGLSSVNISLDALEPVTYAKITGGRLEQVLAGIEAARKSDIGKVKLNTVLMRGINEDQIWPLVRFAAERGMILRFIELMPVSLTEMLDDRNFFPIAEARKLIASQTEIVPDPKKYGHGPAQYFRLPALNSTIGFIGALSDLHFCEACNKMRLTADGKIRPCLGNHGEIDLKPALRPETKGGRLRDLFLQALREKPPEHQFRNQYQPGRIMTAIGG